MGTKLPLPALSLFVFALGCAAPSGVPISEAEKSPDLGGSGGGAGDDLDPGNDTGGGDASGCSKVDFLFIIDNSVSMTNEQTALVASFPGFIAAIQSTLSATSDYHIMVTDTDEWGRCNTANPWVGLTPDSATCNEYIQTTVFEECDRTRGAGVVHPAGRDASNELCAPAGGNRYIVEGEADLAGTFACMATVGEAGHPDERAMDSLVAAVSAEINGGCNAGFLRDDAILVVTFITDERVHDTGGPQDWYDAVVAAKGGNADAVAVLGLVPSAGSNQYDPLWSEFIALWGSRGIEGSVSEPDYAPFFEQALVIIDDTCDGFDVPH